MIARVPFSVAWASVGVHTYNWWWVRCWGRMVCGCLRNPIMRRVLFYNSERPVMVFDRFPDLYNKASDGDKEVDS